MSDPIDGLQKLKTMLEMGLVSQEEFAVAKAEILSGIVSPPSIVSTQISPQQQDGVLNPEEISGSMQITCPFCAEDIQAAAIKCKHCGSNLKVPDQPSSQPPSHPGVQSGSQPPPHPNSKTVWTEIEHGRYMFSGHYLALFQIACQALQDCGLQIGEKVAGVSAVSATNAKTGARIEIVFIALGKQVRVEMSSTEEAVVAQVAKNIQKIIAGQSNNHIEIGSASTSTIPIRQETDMFAILCFSTGMLGFFFLPMVFVPICYISSIISYHRFKDNPNMSGKGLRITGSILGAISMLYLFHQLGIINWF